MTISEINPILEALSYIATIIGIPVAIVVFIYQKRNDRLAHELDTYLQANEKYIQYLMTCIEHPELGFLDNSMSEPAVKESGFSAQQLAHFTMLVSVLETGYLLYRHYSSMPIESQWEGWHDYVAYWATRNDFRKAWKAIGPQFDTKFQYYVDNQLSKVSSVIDP